MYDFAARNIGRGAYPELSDVGDLAGHFPPSRAIPWPAYIADTILHDERRTQLKTQATTEIIPFLAHTRNSQMRFVYS